VNAPQQYQFNQPRAASGGAAFEWDQYIGVLVLIEPKGIEHGIETKNGPADAIAGDVTFVDPNGGPQEYLDALIFPKVVFSQCKDQIGGMVLGRVGPYTSKAGRNTVQISEFTPQDAQIAGQYLTQRNALRAQGQFNQPQQPQQGQQGQQAPAQQQAQAYQPAQQQPPQYQQGGMLPQGMQPAQVPPGQQVGYGQPPQATPPF